MNFKFFLDPLGQEESFTITRSFKFLNAKKKQ